MILTDGTTSLTFDDASTFTPDQEVERSEDRSAGGKIKTQVGGERFIYIETLQVNGSELRGLLNLIKNGSNTYFYTPSETPPEFVAADFPIAVVVQYQGKNERFGDGEIKYFVELRITGIDYV